MFNTRLIVSSDVQEGSAEASFTGRQENENGVDYERFSRVYSSVWDYRESCDEVSEYSWGRKYQWDYLIPIVLRSSLASRIILSLTQQFSGSRAVVSLRCVSFSE